MIMIQHNVCVAWRKGLRQTLEIIKEILCVKYGLISLPLSDVSQVDFMLESLCTQLTIFTNILSVLFVRFNIKHIGNPI